MNITKHNCEAVFLDYYEKNLSPVEVAELLFFLEENPDMKNVFEGYKAIFLEHEKVNFPNKASLKYIYNGEVMDTILSSEIDKTSCEQFFVASIEGMLSELQNQKLNLFLTQYPELKKDFELFKKCKLTAESTPFEDKNLLKKETINIQNREEYFIRAIEGDLSSLEQKQLASFLQKNKEHQKDFELFKKTILVSEKIVFEFKSRLKRKERKPVLVFLFSQRSSYYAAAAAILLLVGLFFFLKNSDNKTVYFADKNNSFDSRGIEAQKENSISAEKEEAITAQKTAHENRQDKKQGKTFVNKNPIVKHLKIKEEKNIIQPVLMNDDAEETLIAEKTEEKKLDQGMIENALISQTSEIKTDSLALVVVKNEAIAATITTSKKSDEYLTVASVINKKIKSILGIKKSTECEISDKISLWGLAMVAKEGVQKIIGTKTLDVNKVCEDSGQKTEYIFTAGNFEISKKASK